MYLYSSHEFTKLNIQFYGIFRQLTRSGWMNRDLIEVNYAKIGLTEFLLFNVQFFLLVVQIDEKIGDLT